MNRKTNLLVVDGSKTTMRHIDSTFGGYCLDHWFAETGEHHSSDGYGVIIELMKTLEVESWEELKNKYVRVEIEGWGGKILRIGHLMKDKWFSFKDYFEQVKKMQEVKEG